MRPGFELVSGDVGFVVDEVALGQVLSEYFGFRCQFSFHSLVHNHRHLSSGAGTIGQIVAEVPMVRSDISKHALIFFSLQEYTQQIPLLFFLLLL
jgi:hypothetical protein